MAAYMSKNELTTEFSEKTIIGEDLTGFYLQPGYVEEIMEEKKRYDNLEQAYGRIFRNNKEYAVFLWNGIPVRLSYTDDIPFMIRGIINMIHRLLENHSIEKHIVSFCTPNLEVVWFIKADEKWVEINSKWKKTGGHYETALNFLSILIMPKKAFLYEWKLLCIQLVEATKRSKIKISDKTIQNLTAQLRKITAQIPQLGRFYSFK